MTLIEELKARGLIAQYSDEEKVKEILDKPTTVYCGFDPSAASMHVGNFVMISLLMRFQRAGHRIIALVGGATGMIGDPSGKSKERNLQGKEALEANTNAIKAQLEKFIDLSDPTKGIILNNYEWLGSLSMIDFLRDYGKYFPINYMLSKEIVSSRLEAGISFTEFSYQILQSIDFYHLLHEYGCRIQLGGNDQWGNLTSGLELIRKADGDNQMAGALTAHLITRSDGKKFGKSEDGALFLDGRLTSPYKLYQYFLNVTDEDAVKYLKVFSFKSLEEIENIAKEHFAAPGARIAQKALAEEMVSTIHGPEALKEALKITQAFFLGNVKDLSAEEIEDVLSSVKKEVEEGIDILSLLVTLGAASSKTEARTFVKQNGVSVNGEKVSDPSAVYTKENALHGKYLILKRGKKNNYLGILK